MKYALIYILFLVVVVHLSCGQNQTNPPKGNSQSGTAPALTSPGMNDPGLHTRYAYTDAAGKRVIIQNSYPKGRLRHVNGKDYVGAIFWTRIINETDTPLEMQMDFSKDAYEIPGSVASSVNNRYLLIFHTDTLASDKAGLVDYGLTGLDYFLASRIDKPSSLKKTIAPATSSGFYVVRLYIKPDSGWPTKKADENGVTRAGLSLQGQELIYTLNGKDIPCGQVNLKNLINTAQDNRRVGYSESQIKDAETSTVPIGMVRNVKQARNGDILVAAYLAAFRHDGTAFTNLTGKVISPRFASFWDVLEDRKGNIWFGTRDSGVYCYNGKSFQHFTTREGLASNGTMHIYEDRAGNIWLGASRYDGQSFRNFTTKDGFPSNNIRLLLEDKTGKLWFGARGENLFVYDGKSFTVLKNAAGKGFNNVWSVIEDKKGNIWFGDMNGLWRYDGNTFTRVSQRRAYSIIQDKKGNIWTTGEVTPNGWAISRYEATSLYDELPAVTTMKQGGGMAFLGILEANDGSIWFGSNNGVHRYDGKTFKNFNNAAGKQ